MVDIESILLISDADSETYKSHVLEATKTAVPEDVHSGAVKNQDYNWIGIFVEDAQSYASVLKAAQELFSIDSAWVYETLEHEMAHVSAAKAKYGKYGQDVECFYGLRLIVKNDGTKAIAPLSRYIPEDSSFNLPIESEIAITKAPKNYLSEYDIAELMRMQ